MSWMYFHTYWTRTMMLTELSIHYIQNECICMCSLYITKLNISIHHKTLCFGQSAHFSTTEHWLTWLLIVPIWCQYKNTYQTTENGSTPRSNNASPHYSKQATIIKPPKTDFKAKCSKQYLCKYLNQKHISKIRFSALHSFKRFALSDFFLFCSLFLSPFSSLSLSLHLYCFFSFSSVFCLRIVLLCLQLAEFLLSLLSPPLAQPLCVLFIGPFGPRLPSRLCLCQNPAAFHWMPAAEGAKQEEGEGERWNVEVEKWQKHWDKGWDADGMGFFMFVIVWLALLFLCHHIQMQFTHGTEFNASFPYSQM